MQDSKVYFPDSGHCLLSHSLQGPECNQWHRVASRKIWCFFNLLGGTQQPDFSNHTTSGCNCSECNFCDLPAHRFPEHKQTTKNDLLTTYLLISPCHILFLPKRQGPDQLVTAFCTTAAWGICALSNYTIHKSSLGSTRYYSLNSLNIHHGRQQLQPNPTCFQPWSA